VVKPSSTSCSPTTPNETPAAAPDTPRSVVYADGYALAYFAQRIGGDDFTVIFPVPTGEEPEK
jgi:ABC-type Zn uptake system ZnuABC Zn-binding protein ZnuA